MGRGGITVASEEQFESWALYKVEPWPPEDAEESILGTVLHEPTITNLRLGINAAARVGLQHGEPSSWQAITQIELLGCRRPDGSSHRTYPDVFVYRRVIAPTRGSFL